MYQKKISILVNYEDRSVCGVWCVRLDMRRCDVIVLLRPCKLSRTSAQTNDKCDRQCVDSSDNVLEVVVRRDDIRGYDYYDLIAQRSHLP